MAKFIETEEFQREAARDLLAARTEWARAAAAEAAGFKDVRDEHPWMAALSYAAASARLMTASAARIPGAPCYGGSTSPGRGAGSDRMPASLV